MRRPASLLMLLLLVTFTGSCSDGSSDERQGTTVESAVPTALTPSDVTTGCENFPTQTVPPASDQDEIAALTVVAWPEGPNAAFGQPDTSYPANWVAAFEDAKQALSLPLPSPVPNGCCSRPGSFVVYITFTSGATAVYGPCELPGNLAAVARTLYDGVL